MAVRPATVADAGEIQRIWNAQIVGEDYRPWTLQSVTDRLNDPKFVWRVDESDAPVAVGAPPTLRAFLYWQLPAKGSDASCSQALGSDPALPNRQRLRAVRDVILAGFAYEVNAGRDYVHFWAKPATGTNVLFRNRGIMPVLDADGAETEYFFIHMPTVGTVLTNTIT